jgi:hypothetical protein
VKELALELELELELRNQTMPDTPMDPIQAAIEQAKKAAEAAVLAQAQQSAVTVAAPAPAAPAMPGRRLTMDDFSGASMAVDSWLGVNEHGLLLGPNKALYTEPLKVRINLPDVAAHECVKFGNPPTYLKTYDGVTCASGGTWAQALDRARKADPNSRSYPSADIPMTAVEDVFIGKSREPVVRMGERLGHTLSTTNWANWYRFYDLCRQKGLAGGEVTVELGAERRSNKHGNTWGVMTFTLVE